MEENRPYLIKTEESQPITPVIQILTFFARMKKQPSAMTYQAAYAELQVLLKEVQSESVSMDELAAKIARATELIQYCRERLRLTEEQVQHLTTLTRTE